jgi:predicted RNA methylase
VTVVDLGCGTGVFAADAADLGVDVIGVDPSSAMIDACRRSRPGRATG